LETRKTILVVGAGGMLGHKVAQVLAADDRFAVTCVTRRPVDARFAVSAARYVTGVDALAGASVLAPLLAEHRPHVIINALGAVKQRDLASAVDGTYYLNGTVPHLLALLNPNPEGRVIHFSTDCVFTGTRGNYRESDAPDVVDLYGRSKACGELAYGRHLTIRTSMIGFEIATHLSLIAWLLQQPRGATIRGFTNAIFSGLPTVTLATTVQRLLVHHPTLAGLYHVAAEPIRKFDLLSRLNAAFDLGLQIDPDPSVTIDRSLDDSHFRTATGTTRPDWDTLVAELVVDARRTPYAALYPQLAAWSDATAASVTGSTAFDSRSHS